ncbi:ribosome maturation factor RimM [Polymorphum gilvum]|uniref:Ribosome maturation factor RimM n=1 Tax=Polymorphum gilvum (strain LMG 25793 / CGMCC 1.9160 / SL003B-26A1) TaxID=991905 RepID=F2IZA9_POLGS|nr:ribosome maturation factor RimM [Polymorphum gilvum]ADZ68532.1 Ribosome maturation factor rimM [Polymorphum gilvum SL003B-26A1]
MSSASDRILMARIGAAHGVRGEVRVKPFGDDPLSFADYGPLETADGSRRFEVVGARVQKTVVITRFKGIDDRTAAEALNGLDLYVPRERLPEPGDDEFYHADLIGLEAVDAAASRFGTVVAVQDFGAGDLLEIRPDRGRSFYVPFTQAFVPTVDLAAGRVVLDLPDDYLSEGTDEDRSRTGAG